MAIPDDTVSLLDYERHFRARIDPAIGSYINGPAGDGQTKRANREAFERHRLMPSVLADMRGASAKSVLLGAEMAYPILLAPTAYHQLVHPQGELATVEAAGLTRTVMTVSLLSSVRLEAIAKRSITPLWFQLYLQRRREETLSLVRRAEEAGYRALVVTVDAPVNGMRNAQARAGFKLPMQIRPVNLDGLEGSAPVRAVNGSPVFQGMLDEAARWEDIAWLRDNCRLPLILKGILNPHDALRAVEVGVDALVVSNHGGRILDGLPASLDVLPLIADRLDGRVPLILDGGIRRGTDIVKALGLGASAVMVGEPVLHALHIGGMPGVAHMLTVLQTEFEVAMALLGKASLAEIDRSVLF
ncbi:alpha-hydroxy acid oxidase [Rhizobium rhizoryzae]|uniref:alpha-hydroxy acid oxidase n=1 Tax=Rhizobium rhizoryzae TaxID=451876 RepID=UPI0028A63E01|nr:alpha-hydroxy acid oxidase [Rhizobium rhizoryzae]